MGAVASRNQCVETLDVCQLEKGPCHKGKGPEPRNDLVTRESNQDVCQLEK